MIHPLRGMQSMSARSLGVAQRCAAVALAAILLAPLEASAITFDTPIGDDSLNGVLNTTVTIGAAWRMQGRASDLIGKSNLNPNVCADFQSCQGVFKDQTAPARTLAAAPGSFSLNGDDGVIEEVRNIYRNRRDVMVESFERAGWSIPVPKATMFAWAPIPDQFAHMGSLEFAKHLIRETGVAVAPGVGFGEYGDQYVRLAFVENEQRIRQAARNIKKMMLGTASHGNVVPLQAAK